VFLEEGQVFSRDGSLYDFLVLFNERCGLNILGNKISGFSEDSNGNIVVRHDFFEFSFGFSSISIEFIDFSLISFDFGFFGCNESLNDGSLGIEITF
jgi:hypothetical protein